MHTVTVMNRASMHYHKNNAKCSGFYCLPIQQGASYCFMCHLTLIKVHQLDLFKVEIDGGTIDEVISMDNTTDTSICSRVKFS